MTPFVRLRGLAAPMPQANIDTDQIYPSPGSAPRPRDLSAFSEDETGEGPNAFGSWRWTTEGDPNPDFVLNQPRYASASIIVAGENFGCGSSREMAVWALRGAGFRCVIAPSFGDIFYGNCFRNGLLPVRLGQAAVGRLLHQASSVADPALEVDLEACTVVDADGETHGFEVDGYRRQMLLGGLDEIEATLQYADDIARFQSAYLKRMDWLA